MPPMHVPTLMAECDPPQGVAALTGELIARKAVTRELGEGPLPEVIARFVAKEFEAARGAFEGVRGAASAAAREEADAVFRGMVGWAACERLAGANARIPSESGI
jgi:uncharacterized protein